MAISWRISDPWYDCTMVRLAYLFNKSPVRGLLVSELNEGTVDDPPEVADEEEDGSWNEKHWRLSSSWWCSKTFSSVLYNVFNMVWIASCGWGSGGGGSIAQWLAYLLLDPAAPGSNHVSWVFSEKILDVAQLTALHFVRVDSEKSLLNSWSNPSSARYWQILLHMLPFPTWIYSTTKGILILCTRLASCHCPVDGWQTQSWD